METNGIVSPYFENGVFAGARVTIGDEDFVIAPKDYKSGKEMPWQEAMDNLKADNLATWNYRQICLTMAYRKEVDKVLVDNGGDSLDKGILEYVVSHLAILNNAQDIGEHAVLMSVE